MEIGMTLLGQALSFAILIWFTMKFIWPPLTQAMDERARRIAEGLNAAEGEGIACSKTSRDITSCAAPAA